MTQTSVIALSVEPIEKAKAYLESLSSEYNSKINNNEIEIIENIENVPELVEKLVNQGIKIYGIRKVQQSLEGKFLEMTEGKEIE